VVVGIIYEANWYLYIFLSSSIVDKIFMVNMTGDSKLWGDNGCSGLSRHT
jgi:hypothetical protein